MGKEKRIGRRKEERGKENRKRKEKGRGEEEG